jgi:hypothetical protein
MTADCFRASAGLTVGRCVKRAGASASAGLGPEISDIDGQIESQKKKIKTLTVKFEAEGKGTADRITKKEIEVNTELSLQRSSINSKIRRCRFSTRRRRSCCRISWTLFSPKYVI